MDYETADGSQFSLREIWSPVVHCSHHDDNDDEHDDCVSSRFEYTSVTAIVNGVAYACRIDEPADSIDHVEIAQRLEAVPVRNIYPLYESTDALTVASIEIDVTQHYLKSPSFLYDDCLPGRTFVADCFLQEARVLQRLRASPHPNLVSFHGCILRQGRIVQLCIPRFSGSLTQFLQNKTFIDVTTAKQFVDDIRAGVQHLHSMGLAHNDLNPENICIDMNYELKVPSPRAVIIDMDSCLPFGEKLTKGIALGPHTNDPLSDAENDFRSLDALEDFLNKHIGH